MLLSDGNYSFAVFNYSSITWTSVGAGLMLIYATAGFNAGDGISSLTLTGSGTENFSSEIANFSPLGTAGLWLFRVDGDSIVIGGTEL